MVYSQEWCKMYITITAVMFAVGAALYGLLARFSIGLNLGVLGAAVMGGYLLSVIFACIMITSNYLGKKSLTFKLLCSIFFFITYFAAVFFAMVMTIPIFIKSCLILNRQNKSQP